MYKKLYQSLPYLSAWQKIISALLLGIIAGSLLGHKTIVLKPIGILFIHAINLMVVPVVFTAVVCAVLSMDNLKTMRRVSLKAILIYTISMAVAACIGLIVATFIAPGSGLEKLNIHSDLITNIAKAPTLTEAIINIVPSNPMAAFISGNILQILVFALILGISIHTAGEKAKPIANLFKSLSVVTICLSQLIMRFAPIGIFALMAWVTGEYGMTALLPLLKLVLTIYFCCFLLCILFYAPTLSMMGINPFRFFKNIRNPLLLAFSTASSSSILPVTIRCTEENIGVPKNLASFLLPLGTTMNLNGLSIYLSVSIIFAANMSGVDLNFMQYITVVITIILTAMGAGGVPGSTIVVMGAVLNSVGLPLTAVSLIAGVDRLNDMAGTTTNVIGDVYAATLIAKSEGVLTTSDTREILNVPQIQKVIPS